LNRITTEAYIIYSVIMLFSLRTLNLIFKSVVHWNGNFFFHKVEELFLTSFMMCTRSILRQFVWVVYSSKFRIKGHKTSSLFYQQMQNKFKICMIRGIRWNLWIWSKDKIWAIHHWICICIFIKGTQKFRF
jgi:hypothetical protein